MEVAKWLAIGASYIALLITIIKVGISSVKRNVEVNLKILEIEKEVNEMSEKHSKDILKIEIAIEGIKADNRNEHSRLFEKLDVVGQGVADITGYLRAKQERGHKE